MLLSIGAYRECGGMFGILAGIRGRVLRRMHLRSADGSVGRFSFTSRLRWTTVPTKKPNEATPEEAASKGLHLRQRLQSLQQWVFETRLRKIVAGSVAFVGFIFFLALWSYLAHLAVSATEPVTIEMALEALDEQNTEKAKNIIGKLQQQTVDVESLGGSLFVLGAAKALEADQEWSGERRRAMHLVAARYLKKALGARSPRRPRRAIALSVGAKPGPGQPGRAKGSRCWKKH